MKRSLGIDYGGKRIGLAIADEVMSLAVPVQTIERKKTLDETILYLEKVLEEKMLSIEKIVVGLPLHLNGTDSPFSLECRQFAKALEEKLNKKVVLFDERFSSAVVENDLRRLGIKRKKRGKHLDSSSACLILQNYLDQYR